MKKFVLGTLLATAIAGTQAHAQILTTLINPTTNNGSFETPTTGKIDFTPTTSSTAVIPFWGSTAGTNDTGVNNGADIAQNGTRGAFEKPGTGIFNLVTSRPIVAGDAYTLTFYARDTNGGTATEPLTASFYSQTATATGTTYGYTPISTLATITPTLTNAAAFAQYTLTYTATAADAGNDIGIVLTNSGGDYNGLDNFVLNVSAVPEPNTYTMLAVGGLVMTVFRRRRA